MARWFRIAKPLDTYETWSPQGKATGTAHLTFWGAPQASFWEVQSGNRPEERGRKQHYKDLCDIDWRIALAGEHAPNLPAWQEGAVLSSLDAISRLHQRVVAG